MGVYRPWRGLPDGLTGEARTDGMDATESGNHLRGVS